MTASLVTLDGYAASSAYVVTPSRGAWWLDVTLTEPVVFDRGQAVTAVVAGVTLKGVVLIGDAADGRASYRVVGGAGGWQREIKAKGYRDSGGVKVRTILSDAASDAGETISDVPTTRVAEHFTREKGPAHRVLNALLVDWYIDSDGTTRAGAREATTYTGDGTITRRDRAAGVVEVTADDVAQLVPGVQVDGQAPATDVEWILDGDRLTARVYYAPSRSRRVLAMARILDALDPFRHFRGTYEYRVVAQSGDRLDLQIVRSASGMPDLAAVPVRPGMAGMRADVTPGSLVLVTFVDGDPSRPAVVAHSAPDAPGWMPLFLVFGEEPSLPVARLGDAVQAGPFVGVITGTVNQRTKVGV